MNGERFQEPLIVTRAQPLGMWELLWLDLCCMSQ